jgi:cytochrome bd ubiquinol oxidase subunit I
VQGLNIEPASDEPTLGEVNTVHLAWDVMIGMGTLMCLIALWYWACWIFRRDMPHSRWFLRVASATGIMSVIALESGWVVSEVGRQPWIVYNLMKVEAAATANTGVWVTFLGVVVLYAGLGATTILILRGMSRRFREQDERGQDGFDETDSPYGPNEPVPEHRAPVEAGSR